MRRRAFTGAALIVLFSGQTAGAQVDVDPEVEAVEGEASQEGQAGEEPSRPAEASLFIGEEHAVLFEDVEVDGYERLEAGISVEDKGATISWAPWLYEPDYSLWNETRFQLAHKDGITRLGVSLKLNPLAPYSKHGRKLWNTHQAAWLENVPALEEQAVLAQRAVRELERRDQRRDEAVVPKLAGVRAEVQRLKDLLSDPAANGKRKELQDELAAQLKELAKLEAEAKRIRLERAMAGPDNGDVEELDLGRAEIDAARRRYDEYTALADKPTAAAVRSYNEALLRSGRPVLGLSYAAGFFSILGGDDVDADDDDLEDNAHQLASRSLAATADWRLGASQISALVGRTWERASAEEGSTASEYDGFGVTVGHRLIILDKEYAKSQAYLEKLFIPSVIGGLAFEYKDCRSDDTDCKDGLLRETALTAFVDFKISPTAQFRIGIPAREKRVIGGEDKTEIGVTTLIAFQLGSVK